MNKKKEYDLLIVGADIYGATAAYKAKQEGKNCFGIEIHPHGDVYKCPKIVISCECSSDWHFGIEQFYAVNDERYNNIYSKYKELAKQEQHAPLVTAWQNMSIIKCFNNREGA